MKRQERAPYYSPFCHCLWCKKSKRRHCIDPSIFLEPSATSISWKRATAFQTWSSQLPFHFIQLPRMAFVEVLSYKTRDDTSCLWKTPSTIEPSFMFFMSHLTSRSVQTRSYQRPFQTIYSREWFLSWSLICTLPKRSQHRVGRWWWSRADDWFNASSEHETKE
jgi:hypothetical protein